MKIHDISIVTSPETLTWEGTETGYSHAFTLKMSEGAVCNLSVITDGVHCGTHLDSPLHFIDGGPTVDALDLNDMIGPAVVVEIASDGNVTGEDLDRAGIPAGTKRLILKTENTRRKRLGDGVFHYDYSGLAPSGATWLVEHGIRLVGIDYLSIGPYGDENPVTHKILLGAGLVIVETLDLTKVTPGLYFLVALCPKLAGVEGSPCRAVLIEGIPGT
jgi:arylformamidase